jgi:hypothetical protein
LIHVTRLIDIEVISPLRYEWRRAHTFSADAGSVSARARAILWSAAAHAVKMDKS